MLPPCRARVIITCQRDDEESGHVRADTMTDAAAGWPEDADALARAIGHETVVTKLSRVPWPYTQDDARQFLNRAWEKATPRFLITVSGEGDQPIGCVGIHYDFEIPNFGYWLTPTAWGHGYATEAGHAVLAIARDALRLRKLRATWSSGNAASGRVLEKLGFQPTGRIVSQFSLALGQEVDAIETELNFVRANQVSPTNALKNRPIPVS